MPSEPIPILGFGFIAQILAQIANSVYEIYALTQVYNGMMIIAPPITITEAASYIM